MITNMEEKIAQLETQVQQLKEIIMKNNFPDNMVYDKKVTCNDILYVRKGIKFHNGSEIWSGDEINDAGIKAEIGYTSPNGSLYLSTSPTQPFFIMVGTTWTLMNIP